MTGSRTAEPDYGYRRLRVRHDGAEKAIDAVPTSPGKDAAFGVLGVGMAKAHVVTEFMSEGGVTAVHPHQAEPEAWGIAVKLAGAGLSRGDVPDAANIPAIHGLTKVYQGYKVGAVFLPKPRNIFVGAQGVQIID